MCLTFAARAKRVIYLHQSGAPSQIELFDYKPKLAALAGSELPDSIRQGQRITGMTSGQNSLPVAPSLNLQVSAGRRSLPPGSANCLPHTCKNCRRHNYRRKPSTPTPSITILPSPSCKPALCSPVALVWVRGSLMVLGSENHNLPSFVVLISQANALNRDQPLFTRLWSSGFPAFEVSGRAFPRIRRPRPVSCKPRWYRS